MEYTTEFFLNCDEKKVIPDLPIQICLLLRMNDLFLQFRITEKQSSSF